MPVFRPQYYESGVYHIYNRGVAKLPTFLDSEDYHSFTDILRYFVKGFPLQSLQKYANLPVPKAVQRPDLPVTYKADPLSNGLFKPLVDVIGYCLMPNHFHLLVQLKQLKGGVPKPDGRFAYFQTISELVRRLGITYSHKFNKRHNREGALFQGRYKIKHIPADPDVLQVIRYIHLNPVVAGIVVKPEHWLFSDFRAYTTVGVDGGDRSMRTFQVTKTDLVLSYFNGSAQRYGEFVRSAISEQEAAVIGKYILDEVEEHTS